MVACRYRWLAAFLPFIDIKKQKALLAILCLRNFPVNEKNKHTIDQSSKPQQPTSWDFYFQIMWYNSGKHEKLFYKTRATLTINRRRYRANYFVAP